MKAAKLLMSVEGGLEMENKIMQIKSKQRVKDHGEVFTREKEVNAMLDLVKNEIERIESRFLEPACGDGNFLAPVLARKISLVKNKYGKSQHEFERMALFAISSVYGIELLKDNVEFCIERLYKIFNDIYTELYNTQCKDNFRKSVKFVIRRNILHGDALTLKTVDRKGHIIFSEWSLVSGKMVKRRDFTFYELISNNDQKGGLFSEIKLSDIGTSVFIPEPVKEFPLMHYLKLNYEDAK